MSDAEGARDTSRIAALRLFIGAAQGGLLYFLYHASEAHIWPATTVLVFAPIVIVALFIPICISFGLSSMRARTLWLWTAIAALAVAEAAHHGVWKAMPPYRVPNPEIFVKPGYQGYGLLPDPDVFFFGAIWLIITFALVAAADTDRRLVARYTTYFDVSWKLAVQLALGAVFVGLFWGLLWLGAELFNLLKLDFLERLIEHDWFAIPASALASAAAIHLTDVRAGLVRGVRTLLLVLLSWLLPLLTILVAGFLVALTFTGLEPLWQTRHGGNYLLVAAAILVILVNAAYQDGDAEHRPPRLIRYACSAAAFALVPLVVLSAYALYLRVNEYGWTSDRVACAACIVVAACYASGYAASAANRREWLKLVEPWNVASAVLILLVLAAVYSPIADPDRIAAANQVARLERGAVAPDRFDSYYLRWRDGVYGIEALSDLAHTSSGRNAAAIRSLAAQTLAGTLRPTHREITRASDIVANVQVYPKGARLPDDFLRQNWATVPDPYLYPGCLRHKEATCDAYVLDLSGNGSPAIVILNDAQQNMIFSKDASGVWRDVGRPGTEWLCDAVIKELRLGRFSLATPQPLPFKEIIVKGTELTILPAGPQTPACPR